MLPPRPRRGPAPTARASQLQLGRVGKETTEFRVHLHRRESLRAGTRVRDVPGHRHHGLISTSNGGHLRKVNGHPGKAAKFPWIVCGRALISVRTRAIWTWTKPFWFGTSIGSRTRRPGPAGTQHHAQGSDQPARRPVEVRTDRVSPPVHRHRFSRAVVVRAARHIDTSAWHTLQCRRQNGAVSLWIDGAQAVEKSGAQVVSPTMPRCGSAPGARRRRRERPVPREDGQPLLQDRSTLIAGKS